MALEMIDIFRVLAQTGEPAPGGFVDWLLGLDILSGADSRTEIGWRFSLPLWVWILIIAATGALAGMSYRRMVGKRGGRLALAAVRGLVLLLIAILLAGPMLVLKREDIDQDRVPILIDRSASMSVGDIIETGAPEGRLTRQAQLERLLKDNGKTLAEVGRKKKLEWLGFGQEVWELSDIKTLGRPEAMATGLRTALRESVQRGGGRPISAIIVFSDGRSSEPIGPETYSLLSQVAAPVHVVPLGSADQWLDLSINRLEAPDTAFVKDTVPILLTVSQAGGKPGADGLPPTALPKGTEARLVDVVTGKILDKQPVTTVDEPVLLQTTPELAGTTQWRVEVATAERELSLDNNRQNVAVRMDDRPIRVLYIEGYPRWEYRYIKNMLVREDSIKSSIMLISADRTFAQEGDIPLRRLPKDDQELKEYDVIIIGDVPSDFFSVEQLELFSRHASRSGAGILWIGGEQDMPASYGANALSPLLPMLTPGQVRRTAGLVRLEPTRAAATLGILRLRDPQASGVKAALWPENLPPLEWSQDLGALKPTAEVLAQDKTSQAPLVARMRYGAGQSIYIATDEIWRWRMGRGDLWPDQFFLQIFRLLARSRLQGAGEQRMRIEVSRQRATVSDTVTVRLHVNDPSLLKALPESVSLAVEEATEEGDSGSGVQQEVLTVRPSSTRPGMFEGTWTPARPGKRLLKLADPALASLAGTARVTIAGSDDEMRYPAGNHALLAELAAKTGGKVLKPEDLAKLAQWLPNRERRTAADISEPLWNSPLAFILMLILLTGEWIGRKVIGLA